MNKQPSGGPLRRVCKLEVSPKERRLEGFWPFCSTRCCELLTGSARQREVVFIWLRRYGRVRARSHEKDFALALNNAERATIELFETRRCWLNARPVSSSEDEQPRLREVSNGFPPYFRVIFTLFLAFIRVKQDFICAYRRGSSMVVACLIAACGSASSAKRTRDLKDLRI